MEFIYSLINKGQTFIPKHIHIEDGCIMDVFKEDEITRKPYNLELKFRGSKLNSNMLLGFYPRITLVTKKLKDVIESNNIKISEFRKTEIVDEKYKDIFKDDQELFEMIFSNYGSIKDLTDFGKLRKRSETTDIAKIINFVDSEYFENEPSIFYGGKFIGLSKTRIKYDYFIISDNIQRPYITENFKNLLLKNTPEFSFRAHHVYYDSIPSELPELYSYFFNGIVVTDYPEEIINLISQTKLGKDFISTNPLLITKEGLKFNTYPTLPFYTLSGIREFKEKLLSIPVNLIKDISKIKFSLRQDMTIKVAFEELELKNRRVQNL